MITKNYLKKCCGLLLLLACFSHSSSDLPLGDELPLSVSGEWLPGGLLLGKTRPNAHIQVFDHNLIADANGDFVFGIGRDIKGELEIIVQHGAHSRALKYVIAPREYDIQRINGIAKKYVSPPQEVQVRISVDAAKIRAARATRSRETYYKQGFIWPADGPVTGVYGSQRVFNGEPKRPHYGLDIAGPVGSPIVAPAGGVVTLAENDMYYSGGTLIVDHGYGVSSTFIHLSEILVKEGQRIKQGELIAKMGATGRATGSHLDWRINWFEQRLDPALVLPERTTAKP